jgi:predicted GNAT superfamily acetyltransferase
MLTTITASEFDSFLERDRVADDYNRSTNFHWYKERDGKHIYVDVAAVRAHQAGDQGDVTIVIAASAEEGEREVLELIQNRLRKERGDD